MNNPARPIAPLIALAAVAAPTLAATEPGIRFIESPFSPHWTMPVALSNDGSTLVAEVYGPKLILADRGSGWESVYETDDLVFMTGLSHDGSTMIIEDLSYNAPAQIYRNGTLTPLPALPADSMGHEPYTSYTHAISGDGSTIGTVALYGAGIQQGLLLFKDGVYTDLEFEHTLPGSASLSISGIDYDGDTAIVNAQYSEVGYNGYATRLWDQGVWTDLPGLDLVGDLVGHGAGEISSDGSTVIGSSRVIDNDTESVFGPNQAWIWRDGITTSINDGSFEFVSAYDLTADGDLVLVNAGEGFNESQYLWSFDQGFVDLETYFADHGLVIDTTGLNFYHMSDDATVFAGTTVDGSGVITTVVVTIPAPGAVLVLLGSWMSLGSRRRRVD